MKRADAIASMRIAGYHNDTKGWLRIFVEHRISREVADEAYRAGVRQKQAGVKCSCHECTGVKP